MLADRDTVGVMSVPLMDPSAQWASVADRVKASLQADLGAAQQMLAELIDGET